MGRYALLAFENHALVVDPNDRRDLAVLHGEGDLLDFLGPAVLADRRNPAHVAGAGRVFRLLFGHATEIVRAGQHLGPDHLGLVRVLAGDQAGLDGGTVLGFVRLAKFLLGDLQLVGGQPTQRQEGLDRAGVLGRLDALLLAHLVILLHGQAEVLGHPLDFRVDFFSGDPNAATLALLRDQLRVEIVLQNPLAIVAQTLMSEILAGDRLAVDFGHHVELRLSRSGGRLCLRRALGRPHRLARVATRRLPGRLGGGRLGRPVVADGQDTRQNRYTAQNHAQADTPIASIPGIARVGGSFAGHFGSSINRCHSLRYVKKVPQSWCTPGGQYRIVAHPRSRAIGWARGPGETGSLSAATASDTIHKRTGGAREVRRVK